MYRNVYYGKFTMVTINGVFLIEASRFNRSGRTRIINFTASTLKLQ